MTETGRYDPKKATETCIDQFLQQYLERHSSPTSSPSIAARLPKGRGHRRLFLSLVVICTIIGTVTTLSWPYLAPGPQSRPINKLSAAVIDELSITDPDPSFLSNATGSLAARGFQVDYYSPGQATVSFFQTPPTRGYGLLIIRAHASTDAIITSQPYSQSQYVWPQLTGGLSDEKISNGNDYFAITSEFARNQMQGNFQGATIIVTGCQSLENTDLAAAFIHRGAAAYIGWDGMVSLQYADASTATLLDLIAQGKPVVDAVQTFAARDPVYHSRLVIADSSSLAADQLGISLNLLGQITIAAAIFVPGPIVIGLILRRLWRR